MSGPSCPAFAPVPDLLGGLTEGGGCATCHPEPPPPPYYPPPSPGETVHSVQIPFANQTQGGSPLHLHFNVPLSGNIDPFARIVGAVMQYGFAMISGNEVSDGIEDDWGAGFTTITWGSEGVKALNGALEGSGQLGVSATANFSCVPASPCTATFSTVGITLYYTLPVWEY